MSANNNNSPKKGISKTGSTRDIFKQLYKEPKVFKAKDYAPSKYQFTVARKELAAYAFLCRQQEAREWMQLVLKETFPENEFQKPVDSKSEALMKRSYKSDLFPVLRDGIRLCKIINLVKAGTIAKIADSVGKPFLMLDNINFFLKALKDLGIPDHESFLPLDLLERKNMPRVVYCIHRMAATFYQKYGFGAKIEEKTGAYQFSEDELEKASRDLEEAENESGSRKSQNVQNLQKQLEEQQLLLQQQEEAAREMALARLQEIRRHNEEEVEHSRQVFFLNQITPASVVVEGFSRSEDVSGSKDNDYSIKATVTYSDGSVETKHFLFNTGTHDWEQAVGSVNQGAKKKLIEKIEVSPVFNNDTHQGKVWFDRVSIAENRPQPNYIQFVQNSSFEQSDEQETVAYLWEAETSGKGKNYIRTDDNHAPVGGQWSIRLAADDSNSASKANTYVSIFQNEAAPVVIEAWTKIENLGAKSANAFLGVRASLVFDDDSKENVVLNALTDASADGQWQRKVLYVTPTKPLKGVSLSAEFSGAQGSVLFDAVTLSQEEWKQHVLNPSFEEVKEAEGAEAQVTDWVTEGTHAPRVSYSEWCLYGHTSIECNNENQKDYSLILQKLVLNQKEARQITFEGWSKADNVSGLPDADYSIRVDVVLQDGTKDVIESSPFTSGTHDFESRTFVYVPPADKPIKEATVQAIFKTHTGRVWFDNITANEEYLFGESEIFMLQKILKSLNFDKDLIEDIAELKRQMLVEVRKNYQLERELATIEKKIALLIKNRIDVQEVLQASKRLAKLFKWKSKKDNANAAQSGVIDFIKKKANKYQELFYMLQTEPKYLARLVTLISPAQMEEFLDTIVLTLFGDTYSPREEYLLLRILQEATYNEIVTFKDITGFLEANTVIAKMIVTYSRREQGHLYLVKTLAPLLQRFVHTKELDFELSPMRVWNTSISEEEIASGEKSKRERVSSDEEAMKHPEVVQTLNERVDRLLEITQWFLDEIFRTVEHIPYGLRWISKQIPEISKKKFPNSSLEDIQKIVGYFIYYRFLNPAIVSPDLYDIIRLNLSTNQRRNLVQVSKALQCLFNFANFGDSKINKHIEKINQFIQHNKEKVSTYLSKIVEVPEPADHLMVDNYIELTQGHKPMIVVTFDEVYSTHEALVKNLDQVAKDSKDILRTILNDIGPLPEYDMTEEDSDREIQLTLTNPISEQKAQSELSEEKQSVLAQTRRMTIELMRIMDVDNTSPNLLEFLNNAKRISKKNDVVKTLLDNILANIDQIEKTEKKDKAAVAADIMQEVESYVENEATQRIARKNLISRLKLGLENLLRNQKYMNEQMEQFNIYLNTARAQQSAKKSKKDKKKKFKFTYKKLEKQGIIIRSIVPQKSQKTCTFSISATDNPNEFTVRAKIAGITADTISLLLDDLLEKQSQGIVHLDLDSVTLDVNLTIHMLNKLFYQK
mmetsp:Transcript_13481/g.18624  ORF Transcript_13481/g.18624 Transcript_13481/m.18624 type:complete len:1451 (-) Transcript_13481:48-4400(-)